MSPNDISKAADFSELAVDDPAPAHRLNDAALNKRIDGACARIAPLWPLKSFVAVNPFFGMVDQSFQDASDALARIIGNGLYMPRAYYRDQLASGRVTLRDISAAIERCGSTLQAGEVERILATKAPRPNLGMAPVSEVLERVEGGLWSSFVTERISLHCAAYFDLGQATIQMPWRSDTLYASWLKAAAIDHSPAMMGLGGFRKAIAELPASPRKAIALAVEKLGVPDAAVERFLHASLMSIGGWAAWARYLRWQAELTNGSDDSIVDLLAIRLMWDMLLYDQKKSAALTARWREMLAASMRPPSAKRKASAEIDRIMLNAMEIGFQRSVAEGLKPSRVDIPGVRPSVQAAFCIDVRSEVFRRALETVAPTAQTIGFAGFFGIFVEYVPLGSDAGRSHVPVIFNPSYRICETVADAGDAQAAATRRRQRLGLAKAWKGFKSSATSCFSFVESVGLAYGAKLLSDSFGIGRPVAAPATQGIGPGVGQLRPAIDPPTDGGGCGHDRGVPGIPVEDRVENAERILRAMSLTGTFAKLVMLAGHGSTTVNNPHASGLDCGACAGQTGEASARIVAALLNDPLVREGLAERGIKVPSDTWFLAALHDTTTDTVRLFDTEDAPAALSSEIARLRDWLDQAGELTRMERSALLGLDGASGNEVRVDMTRRSRDWSQVRPEWALANNAAFIAAPRGRTAGLDLSGRAFLHDYDWRKDEGFKILELIMTAPMIVANWINMQYYGSVVDNRRFGSGNKVLHNIAGGAIGVLEGNSGDLRVGLSMQSLHDGKSWVHEPLRLSVYLEAPHAAIDAIIARHDLVRQLVENGWLHLFGIDDAGGVTRRSATGSWDRCNLQDGATAA